jgi:hypothetical protein
MDRAVRQLLTLVDEAFGRRAWHGTNLRGSLRGVSAREAARPPAPGRHNVWELVVHAAYWKYVVRRRLTGDASGSFPHGGRDWFRLPEGAAREADWKRDLALLLAEHRKLRAVVARLRDADLDRPTKGSRQSAGFVVRGIAAHDLYHAGQIQLLKRLARG